MDIVKKTILIIEDEQQLRMVYKRKLEEAGYEVSEYITGAEGLAAIKEKHPGLIILDVMLPGGMNGFDVLESLKKDDATRNIPVLMLSNLDSEEETAKKIGVSDYIVKANISIEDVVEKIKSYFA